MKRLSLVILALALSAASPRAQTVSLSSPAQIPYNITAFMRPYGTLQVSPEVIAQLADPFPGSSFDANKWTAGGTNSPTASNGQAILSLDATNSLTSTLVSVPTGAVTGTLAAAVTGTLAAAAAKTTYVCGFDVSAIGGTAAVGPVTVAGLVGSSMVYQLSSLAAGNTLSRTFTPCVPASAVNTAITADGTATAVDVDSWGFQQ